VLPIAKQRSLRLWRLGTELSCGKPQEPKTHIIMGNKPIIGPCDIDRSSQCRDLGNVVVWINLMGRNVCHAPS